MNVPPCVVDLHFARPGGNRRHLWIPVILLWPLLAVLGLLALALTLVVDAVLSAAGGGQGRWTTVLLCAFETLAMARGLEVRVTGPRSAFDLTVR